MERLIELFHRKAVAAASHFRDADAGQENIRYVQTLHIIHLTQRNISWAAPNGNPKHLRDWNVLLRPELRFVNRQY